MKILIIGMGEVGQGLYKVLSKSYGDIYTKDKEEQIPFKVDVLHICYPYHKNFAATTNSYIGPYRPELTFIHSTVPVGTTKELNELLYSEFLDNAVIHAPIRGDHSCMEKGIELYPMMFGGENEQDIKKAIDYLAPTLIQGYPVIPSSVSELAKLLSLTQYGVAIEFARYAKKCCDKFNVPYEAIKQYTKSYNDFLTQVSNEDIGENHKKFNLNPPEGRIGGHCVLEGMEKINAQIPTEFISCLIKGNDELVK